MRDESVVGFVAGHLVIDELALWTCIASRPEQKCKAPRLKAAQTDERDREDQRSRRRHALSNLREQGEGSTGRPPPAPPLASHLPRVGAAGPAFRAVARKGLCLHGPARPASAAQSPGRGTKSRRPWGGAPGLSLGSGGQSIERSPFGLAQSFSTRS